MNANPAPLKHSGLGIASTVIAVVCGLGLLAVLGYAGYLGMENPGAPPSESDPRIMMIGVLTLGCAAMLLLGAILGLAGLFVGVRRRVFAWVGLVLNALPLLLTIGLMIVGLTMAR